MLSSRAGRSVADLVRFGAGKIIEAIIERIELATHKGEPMMRLWAQEPMLLLFAYTDGHEFLKLLRSTHRFLYSCKGHMNDVEISVATTALCRCVLLRAQFDNGPSDALDELGEQQLSATKLELQCMHKQLAQPAEFDHELVAMMQSMWSLLNDEVCSQIRASNQREDQRINHLRVIQQRARELHPKVFCIVNWRQMQNLVVQRVKWHDDNVATQVQHLCERRRDEFGAWETVLVGELEFKKEQIHELVLKINELEEALHCKYQRPKAAIRTEFTDAAITSWNTDDNDENLMQVLPLRSWNLNLVQHLESFDNQLAKDVEDLYEKRENAFRAREKLLQGHINFFKQLIHQLSLKIDELEAELGGRHQRPAKRHKA
jgi:hypothetical protein